MTFDLFSFITALSTAICAVVGVIKLIMTIRTHSLALKCADFQPDKDRNEVRFSLCISTQSGSSVYLKSVTSPKRKVRVANGDFARTALIGTLVDGKGTWFDVVVAPPPKDGEVLTLKFDICRLFGIKDRFDLHRGNFGCSKPDRGCWTVN